MLGARVVGLEGERDAWRDKCQERELHYEALLNEEKAKLAGLE